MKRDEAAALLARAHRTGVQLEALPEDLQPDTIEEGYDFQDRLIERLGGEVAGWKLGVGSARAKRASGVGQALAGRLLADRIFSPGASIELPHSAPATVEFEIALVLGRDIAPTEEIEEPWSVVEAVHVAFEIVRSRFVDRRAVGWPSFAADNAAFHALVLGKRIDPADISEIRRTLVVEVSDGPAVGSAWGEDETVPLESFADLLRIARRRNVVLRRASIVSTGSLSVPVDVQAPRKVVARYRGLRGPDELSCDLTLPGDN